MVDVSLSASRAAVLLEKPPISTPTKSTSEQLFDAAYRVETPAVKVANADAKPMDKTSAPGGNGADAKVSSDTSKVQSAAATVSTDTSKVLSADAKVSTDPSTAPAAGKLPIDGVKVQVADHNKLVRTISFVPGEPETKPIDFSPYFTNGIASYSYKNFMPAEPPKTLLESGINTVTEPVFKNVETKNQVNYYTAEFLKTASLFASPKIGMYSAVALYGLDNVRTDQGLVDGSFDFAIGGAKGAAVRSLFTYSSRNLNFAAGKGVAMGAINRGAEVVFSREMIENPSAGMAKLKLEVVNPALLAYDAATFVVGEGLFGAANKMTGGALRKSQLASGMSMGASFGIVNGGSGEIIRQQTAGEQLDISKVLRHAALDGGVGALGAGFGIKGSDPRFYKNLGHKISNLDVTANSVLVSAGIKPQVGRRDFVVTGDRTSLDLFSRGEKTSATATVREVKKVLFFNKQGPETTLQVAHNKPDANGNGIRLVPGKSILATCFPEMLPESMRKAHAFPESTGPVIMDSNGKGKLRLISENTYKLDPATYKSLGEMTRLAGPQITINLMAPLAVGNMEKPLDPANKEAWAAFDRELAAAKKAGVDGVSIDVWWGLVEPKPGKFVFPYYEHAFDRIRDHGLKTIPILSLHQCGGNIGDNVFVPIPFWVWNDVAARAGSKNPDYAKYVSEQGNKSPEYVSAWATPHVLPRYRAFMEAFQTHFANRRNDFSEINVSLGPAGEIRYPSYNSHDRNTGYPTRGALQSYSEVAVKAFRDFAVAKYGSEAKAKEAWGDPKAASIVPPQTPEHFFANGEHAKSQYGKDFFDFYSNSLIEHGRQVLGTAVDVFGSNNAPFAGIDIGAKVPGIRWRVGERQGDQYVPGDRLAELNAGLIRTSRGDWASSETGHGYRPLMEMFRDVQKPGSKSRVVPHFTALELADGQDGRGVKSMPDSLASWVGQESNRQGLHLKGENALSFTLSDNASWDRMQSFLKLPGNPNGRYEGLTLLRLGGEVLNTEVGRTRLAEMVKAVKAANAAAEALPEAK
ncbi:MAG: family 14 glycosylhydrolase [Candidatus Melainabacteria bacterium]|nr:family 14 glycosylhydrolase [Candidatus Melainabacteria bacterium]